MLNLNEPDESIELANLRLHLRAGLDFELREHGSETSYVLHDQTTGSYYQIGVPEYAFLSVLDGKTSLQDAVQETSYRLGEQALSIRDAIRTGHWLIESGLAHPVVGERGIPLDNSAFLLDQMTQQAEQHVASQLNPLFIKLPLGTPQPWLDRLSPMFGWIGTTWFFVVWLVTLVLAAFQIFEYWPAITVSAQGIFAANAWLYMLLTLVGLKIAHEVAHGLFCNRYGGRVKETGFVFILFIPIPYVDVTSSWGFQSRWKRIAVASAGMYVEVFLAALATIAWSYSVDPVWRFHLFNVMLLGSLTTILFNANFLMRFDGYYILADLLDIPNLYQKGQQAVQGLWRCWLLGMKPSPRSRPLRERTIVFAYGIGAWLWRIVICISLSILATKLLYGFGVALALFGIAVWLGMPLIRFVKQLLDPAVGDRPNLKWMTLVTAPVTAAVIGGMIYLPWPVHVSAPGMVEYDSPATVRSETAGFVRDVCVAPGQAVNAGDVLVQLENVQLKSQLRQLQLDRDTSLIRSRGYHRDQEIASYQAENTNRSAIQEQIGVIQDRIEALTIRAAGTGVVVGDELDSLTGQFVTEGTRLFQVVDESHKRILFLVRQDARESFVRAKRAVFAPTFDRRRFSGELEAVQPTASFQADVRLTSLAGGNLAARPLANRAEETNSKDQQSVELVAPRFAGQLMLGPDDSLSVKSGMIGHVRLDQYHETIAEHIAIASNRWIDSIFQNAVR